MLHIKQYHRNHIFTCDVCVGPVITPQNAAKQAAAAATQTIAAAQNAAASNKNTAAHQQLVQSCKVRDDANSRAPFYLLMFLASWVKCIQILCFFMLFSHLYFDVYPFLLYLSFQFCVCRQLQTTSRSLSRESVAVRPNQRISVPS